MECEYAPDMNQLLDYVEACGHTSTYVIEGDVEERIVRNILSSVYLILPVHEAVQLVAPAQNLVAPFVETLSFGKEEELEGFLRPLYTAMKNNLASSEPDGNTIESSKWLTPKSWSSIFRLLLLLEEVVEISTFEQEVWNAVADGLIVGSKACIKQDADMYRVTSLDRPERKLAVNSCSNVLP